MTAIDCDHTICAITSTADKLLPHGIISVPSGTICVAKPELMNTDIVLLCLGIANLISLLAFWYKTFKR